MTENVREQMIATFERTFDMPALLASRGFVLPNRSRDPMHIEMVQPSSGVTLLLKKDLETGAWTFQNAHHPADRGRASRYFEAHDRISRDQSLDRLIAFATERNLSKDALAYRRARHEKAPALREMEKRHEIALLQERTTLRILDGYGVQSKQIEGGRFGNLRTPSGLDRLVRDADSLGTSAYRPGDRALVLTERPIDAIGYERSKGDDRAFHVYTGSTLTPHKIRELGHLLADLPKNMKVVLAFGKDERGRELAERVRALAPAKKMERAAPEFGARWADQMQLEHRHARSLQRSPSRGLVH